MALICPALLMSVRWRRRIAWFPVAISSLLILGFPDSSLSREKDVEVADDAAAAKAKVDSSTDQLAGGEIDIGRYYLVRHNYVAALNRFTTVVTHRPSETGHVFSRWCAVGPRSPKPVRANSSIRVSMGNAGSMSAVAGGPRASRSAPVPEIPGAPPPLRLEHFPEKWTPLFRKEMRQTSNLERFPSTARAISWSAL